MPLFGKYVPIRMFKNRNNVSIVYVYNSTKTYRKIRGICTKKVTKWLQKTFFY